MNFVIITSLLFTVIIYPQTGWFWQNPLPQGNSLNSIHFLSDGTALTAGQGGVILRSTDGGLTWNIQSAGHLSSINSLFFLDDIHGWAAGSGGILKTTDKGISWSFLGSYPTIYDVCFTSLNMGFAVGRGKLLMTTIDGGLNWNIISFNPEGYTDYLSIHFIDNEIGWISTGGNWDARILHTSDGGSAWHTIYSNDKLDAINDIYFVNSDTGFAVSGIYNYTSNAHEGFILRTTDGGISWDSQYNNSTSYIKSIDFLDGKTGWLAANNGIILKTTDSGVTWNIYQTGTDYIFLDISFLDAQNGVVVGVCGAMARTYDGGVTWTPISRGPTNNLNDVSFFDELNGMAVGDKIVLRTTDGGENWSLINGVPEKYYKKITMTGPKTATIIGDNSLIYRTTDGGDTWVQQTGIPAYYYGLYFSDNNTGTIVGSRGVIIRTTDAGKTWISQNSGTTNVLEDVFFVDNKTGTAIGRALTTGSTILKTTDGGAHWFQQTSGSFRSPKAVFFTDSITGWIITSFYGSFLRTTNGGTSWFQHDNGDLLQDISFANQNIGTAVGANGKILNTIDGGETWTPQTSGFGRTLTGISMINTYTAITVGNCGCILKTTNGGFIPVELLSFRAFVTNGSIELKWTTAIETNNRGFEVERKEETTDWVTRGFISGSGNTTEQNEYSFIDENISVDRYFYRLKQVDYDGSFEYSEIVEVRYEGHTEYVINQNYPNPFNPSTTVKYSLAQTGRVTLSIYDLLGREVAKLIDEEKPAGEYETIWNASSYPSGVYFIKMQAGQFNETRKLILMK
jgi:photosystem II stability/assembly factor-like uncharacterized protein